VQVFQIGELVCERDHVVGIVKHVDCEPQKWGAASERALADDSVVLAKTHTSIKV
jgi:hypothetical protein